MMGVTVTLAQGRDGILTLAGILIALGVIWRYLIRPVIRFAQRVEKVMESVEEQLYPNHGTSLRDAVTEIQHALDIKPKFPHNNPPQDRQQERDQ